MMRDDELTDCRSKVANQLREIVGNPWRPFKRFGSAVCDRTMRELFAITPTVLTIAQSIYAERDFAVLPVLADALEEAGCDNVDVLMHCRKQAMTMEEWQAAGEPESTEISHVRGCWVVDLLLGKE